MYRTTDSCPHFLPFFCLSQLALSYLIVVPQQAARSNENGRRLILFQLLIFRGKTDPTANRCNCRVSNSRNQIKQVSDRSIENRVLAQLLMSIMEDPYYDSLRYGVVKQRIRPKSRVACCTRKFSLMFRRVVTVPCVTSIVLRASFRGL